MNNYGLINNGFIAFADHIQSLNSYFAQSCKKDYDLIEKMSFYGLINCQFNQLARNHQQFTSINNLMT
jgi:hypothetical protein